MELYVFLPVFQLWEIKEAKQEAILNALQHPDANIIKLLEETEAKYKGKSLVTLSQTSHKYPWILFPANGCSSLLPQAKVPKIMRSWT